MHLRPLSALLLSSLVVPSSLVSQADWTQLNPTTIPGVRSGHHTASDFASLWLFGGRPQPGNFFIVDTWRYTGNQWTQIKPTTSPAGRIQGAMVFDLARGRLVLFGGSGPAGKINDTWEFVSGNWTQVKTTAAPSARWRHGMVYDQKRRQVVLFGGFDTAYNGETWLYDGKNWTQAKPTSSPSARTDAAMAYNPDTGETILFGGITAGLSKVVNDTWKWDGVNWTQITTPASPPPSRNLPMTYDRLRQRMVVFGGLAPTVVNTTWEFDGKTWLQRKTTKAPSPRSGTRVVYIDALQKSLLFGGYHPTAKQLGDFWSYQTDKPASYKVSGSGCKGSAGVPALRATGRPWTGDTLTLEVGSVPASAPVLVSIGISKTIWSGLKLPLPLGFLGAPGCSLRCDVLLALPAANKQGVARLVLPLPANPFLATASFYNQAIVRDPGANRLGYALSNLGEARAGIR